MNKWILLLLLMTKGVFAVEMLPPKELIAKILDAYDPFVSQEKNMCGVLGFPSLEKADSVFYSQLLERVRVVFQVDRSGIHFEIKGKNNDLKEMMDKPFARIREDLQTSIQTWMRNDPMHNLSRALADDKGSQSQIQVGKAGVVSVTIMLQAEDSANNKKVIELGIDVSSGGELLQSRLKDGEKEIKMIFSSIENKGRLYFEKVDMTMTTKSTSQYRRLNFTYRQGEDGLLLPKSISVFLLDASGNPDERFGSFNPIVLDVNAEYKTINSEKQSP